MKDLGPLRGSVDDNVRFDFREVLRSEAESTADGPRAGIACRFYIHFAVADHHRFLWSYTGFLYKCAEALGIGLLGREAITSENVQEVVGHAQAFANASCGSDGLVGEHGHRARRTPVRIVQIAERGKRLKNAFIGICEIEFVFAIVLEEERIRAGE